MRNLHLIFVLTTSLLPFAVVQAAPADVPETGQLTCYTAAGAVTACSTTGQDGDHLAGVAWPSPRFVIDIGAGVDCLTDSLTGLMWMGAPSSTPDTWVNALSAANNLTLCGFTDWRLPNINELESLVNLEVTNQATFLNAQGFTGVQADLYWSSTFAAAFNAWVVNMNDGYVNGSNKSTTRYVWPVRAGR